MIQLFYWSTSGWVKYGRFETMYQVNHYLYKYPKKQWKVVMSEDIDNIIKNDGQQTRIQQPLEMDTQELPLNYTDAY